MWVQLTPNTVEITIKIVSNKLQWKVSVFTGIFCVFHDVDFDGNQWVLILTSTQREYLDIFATTGGF